MAEIKVTPEELEQVAKTVRNSRNYLYQLHQDLYTQTEYIASMWSGATSQRFYQNFNEAKPKMFTVLMEFDKIAEELEKAAEKFRKADSQEVTLEEGAFCGKSSGEKGIDGGKLARDIAGELTGEYDARRLIEGVDPDTGETLSAWERGAAGLMLVAGITPIGKGVKILKSGKKVANTIDAATKLEKQRKTLDTNIKVGKAFEKEMETVIKNEKAQFELNNQVTIMTKSGVRTRVDIGGKDIHGQIELIELKSSPTAPLTKNQKKAFPEIEESGAVIRSKNKPPFEYLEEIPPTKVNVIRKKE
ncbi:MULTISPECIES: WXG100 family type VII secretion target [Bacillus]|uniref:WXG100 family type VII secretion target n=1 Tax=Bacillus TaxID=1386 RepID=UPI0007AB327E|nr:WXG100 family type VII secretion target [Bacillus mycoides]KZD38418.1 hypothetical protein B4083_2394 [Bacillus cereus]OOR63147.1 type VII secretion protein [Bacillus mycoides]PEK91138.1 WXG100 family type VII secretion target [Bacillus mycoides]HDR7632859.1 WXG100 family type VII secretion target [Bacillus mycoides]